jgi:hypothetical protein
MGKHERGDRTAEKHKGKNKKKKGYAEKIGKQYIAPTMDLGGWG